MSYENRTYRRHVSSTDLVSYTVTVQETDLYISSNRNLQAEAQEAVESVRSIIATHIRQNPDFKTSLRPLPDAPQAHDVIRSMLDAGAAAHVGPMASVAGAVAEFTGRSLLEHCEDVIIENGGDIFISTHKDLTVGVFAGASPFSGKIGLSLRPRGNAVSVCTSSGRVGPSLSFGVADAVTVVSEAAALADAVATAAGNMIKMADDIQTAIDFAVSVKGVRGVLVILGSQLGVRGDLELVKL